MGRLQIQPVRPELILPAGHGACLAGLQELDLRFTNISGAGMKNVTVLKGLRRLMVPSRMDDRGMAYLTELAVLRGAEEATIGMGDALNSDAGVASLASLSNLEVLALKGGPALTGLSACKKLNSVPMKATVPVSAQAVACLQTGLPTVRTVEITRPEQC
jgi:hypothetical protein